MENMQFSEVLSHTDKEVYFSNLLIYEIEKENVDKVKWLLLNKKADPNLIIPNQGVSPMHVLAGLENECFSVEVLEIALEERGGDPNIRSADGLTPVHLAAMWGRCIVLELLLKFGGDPFLLEYKFSLNAEDLALKEHQWQTHAILATFSVFNDKHDQLDDHLCNSSSSLCFPLKENDHWPNGLSKMTQLYDNGSIYKECFSTDCKNTISKSVDAQDSNCNMSLDVPEDKVNDTTYHSHQSKPLNSYGQSSHDNKLLDGESAIKEHYKISKKSKVSDQFSESVTKLKKFFGRASFPKLSLGNSPKVDSKVKASKQSL